MLVTLDCLPSLSPFHVLDQLTESSFNLSLGLGCFVDMPNCGCDIPVAALMNIDINLSHLAGWIPKIFTERLRRKWRPSSTEKQRHSTQINLVVLAQLNVVSKSVTVRV